MVPLSSVVVEAAVVVAASPIVPRGFPSARAPTVARMCKLDGAGLTEGYVMQKATFTIAAFDYTGVQQSVGGDTFFVAIRCNSQGTRARAKISDNGDGTYTVVHKPPSAGKYTIAVSLLGEPLPGSPFTCVAMSAWRPARATLSAAVNPPSEVSPSPLATPPSKAAAASSAPASAARRLSGLLTTTGWSGVTS